MSTKIIGERLRVNYYETYYKTTKQKCDKKQRAITRDT